MIRVSKNIKLFSLLFLILTILSCQYIKQNDKLNAKDESSTNNESNTNDESSSKNNNKFYAVANDNLSIKLRILHTNDHHGHYWKNKYGEYGLAARMTLIKQLREQASNENRYVIVLSGGDINSGTLESELLKAKPDLLGMDLIGYDAMAIGNHEFDNPLNQLLTQQKWVSFPFLSANVFYKQTEPTKNSKKSDLTPKRLFKPYIIKELGGLKVAILGLTTEDTPKTTKRENIQNLDFKNPIENAQKIVPQLRKKSNVVIALAHMGHYDNGNNGQKAPGEVALARSVNGIDVIIGGHTLDSKLSQPDIQNNTIIAHNPEWGRHVGKMDLLYDHGQLKLQNYELIPVNLKKKVYINGEKQRVLIGDPIEEDPDMLNLLAPFKKIADQKTLEVIGQTEVYLNGEKASIRKRSTNLGKFFTEAIKTMANADLAITNSGSIRSSIEVGDITSGNVFSVHPFGNTICTVTLSGEELQKYLVEVMVQRPGSGGFPQYTGLSLNLQNNDSNRTSSNSDSNNGTNTPTTFFVNGQPIVNEQQYKVAINNFISEGGDGYPNVKNHPSFENTGNTIVQAIISLIEKRGTIRESDF